MVYFALLILICVLVLYPPAPRNSINWPIGFGLETEKAWIRINQRIIKRRNRLIWRLQHMWYQDLESIGVIAKRYYFWVNRFRSNYLIRLRDNTATMRESQKTLNDRRNVRNMKKVGMHQIVIALFSKSRYIYKSSDCHTKWMY